MKMFYWILLLFSFNLSAEYSNSQENPSAEYVYKLDNSHLEDLKHILLDKDHQLGIYKYCKGEYENIKICCTHPEQCQESWGRKDAADLRKK